LQLAASRVAVLADVRVERQEAHARHVDPACCRKYSGSMRAWVESREPTASVLAWRSVRVRMPASGRTTTLAWKSRSLSRMASERERPSVRRWTRVVREQRELHRHPVLGEVLADA